MRLPRAFLSAVRVIAVASLVVSVVAGSTGQQASAEDNPFNLSLNVALMNQLAEPALDPLSDPPGSFKQVKPNQFDPGKTSLVQAAWLHGIGCPTNATTLIFNPDGSTTPGTFADTACQPGDPGDQRNEGLLLVKTGPTNNFASAVAELTNVKGMTLTELGYDIRKLDGSLSAFGSHCGGGAPRFNVVTSDNVNHFVGCNSAPLTSQTISATGWTRLRWDAVALAAVASPPILPTNNVVKRIVIIFDEGQDAMGGPDQFGAAILDNIDVNGKLVGRGATQAN